MCNAFYVLTAYVTAIVFALAAVGLNQPLNTFPDYCASIACKSAMKGK